MYIRFRKTGENMARNEKRLDPLYEIAAFLIKRMGQNLGRAKQNIMAIERSFAQARKCR